MNTLWPAIVIIITVVVEGITNVSLFMAAGDV
jgi:hypothetical protein